MAYSVRRFARSIKPVTARLRPSPSLSSATYTRAASNAKVAPQRYDTPKPFHSPKPVRRNLPAEAINKSPYYPDSTKILAKDIMTPASEGSAITVNYNATLAVALEKMDDAKVGAVIVTTNTGRVLGILSERDYLRETAVQGRSAQNKVIKDMMSGDIGFASPTHNLDECMQFMIDEHARHCPVVQFGENKPFDIRTPNILHLVGMVTVRDIMKKLATMTPNNDVPTVSDILSVQQLLPEESRPLLRHFFVVAPQTLVSDVIKMMVRYDTGPVLVKDGGELKGIFTERDYVRKIAPFENKDPHSTPVSEVMTSKVTSVHLGQTAIDCIDIFARQGFRHLLASDKDGSCHGILSVRDCMRALYTKPPSQA